MGTNCERCGADLDVSNDTSFVRCARCGTTALVHAAPPWALAGLDAAPRSQREPAAISHRPEELSPLSGELVAGDDLVVVTCTACGAEFEGEASFLRCPSCGVSNTVHAVPPWAVVDDLVPASMPPPPPARPPSHPPVKPPGGAAPVPPAAAPWAVAPQPPVDVIEAAYLQSVQGKKFPWLLVVVGVALACGGVQVLPGLLWLSSRSEPPELVPDQPEPVPEPQAEPAEEVIEVIEADELAVAEPEVDLDAALPLSFPAGASCEEAVRAFRQARPDESIESEAGQAILAPSLVAGDYLWRCGMARDRRAELCVAVHRGQVVGVTVLLQPPSPGLGSCIATRVRALSFPKLDEFVRLTTSYTPGDDSANAPDFEF